MSQIGIYKNIGGGKQPIYGFRTQWLSMVRRFEQQVLIDCPFGTSEKAWINVNLNDIKFNGEP